MVDNLPSALLPQLVTHLRGAGYQRIAVAIDVRSGGGIAALAPAARNPARHGARRALPVPRRPRRHPHRALLETRRKAPLGDDSLTLGRAIARERETLALVAELGHRIDTNDLSANTLRNWVKSFMDLGPGSQITALRVLRLQHGIPVDADLVFDVRCLPSPTTTRCCGPSPGATSRSSTSSSGCPGRPMVGDIYAFVASWLPSLCQRQPQLPHRGHRLHRRPAPLGIHRRTSWPSVSAIPPAFWCGTAPSNDRPACAVWLATWARHLKPGDLLVLALAAGRLHPRCWPWGRWRPDKAVIGPAARSFSEVDLRHAPRIVEVPGPLGADPHRDPARPRRVASDPGPRQYCVRQGWLATPNAVAICAHQVRRWPGGTRTIMTPQLLRSNSAPPPTTTGSPPRGGGHRADGGRGGDPLPPPGSSPASPTSSRWSC